MRLLVITFHTSGPRLCPLVAFEGAIIIVGQFELTSKYLAFPALLPDLDRPARRGVECASLCVRQVLPTNNLCAVLIRKRETPVGGW